MNLLSFLGRLVATAWPFRKRSPWEKWYSQHNALDKEELIAALRKAAKETKFKPPHFGDYT